MNISLIDERRSLDVSAVLLLLYAANLIYALVTHRDVFGGDPPETSGGMGCCPRVGWSGAGPARLLVGRRLAPFPAVRVVTRLGLGQP